MGDEIKNDILFNYLGHLIGPFICHSFCNFMGIPEFDQIPYTKHPKGEKNLFARNNFSVFSLSTWLIMSILAQRKGCLAREQFRESLPHSRPISRVSRVKSPTPEERAWDRGCLIRMFLSFSVVAAMFVIGLLSFIFLLMPLTEPALYNSVYFR